MITPPFCLAESENTYDKKQKHKLKEFSRPRPMRKRPTSATGKDGETSNNNLPNTPKAKHILKVIFLPKLSTNDPTQTQPTIEPKKNIPIAVEMMSEF